MQEDLFKQRYEGLNAGQREAVDSIEGPVMVIAGPGTGKTTVLTLRIANILRKTDTPPDGILALTFTESAVAAMRKKLVGLIGPAAYRVGIFTFHGFAEEVIHRYPEYFPRVIGGDVATESEKLAILEKIIEEGDFAKIKPFGSPFYYVPGALHTISDLKRDAVTPDKFFEVLKREEELILGKEDLKHEKGRYQGEMKSAYKDALANIEKNRELGKLYEEYEKMLAERHLYDFDDMLLELLSAFEKHSNLLQSLQEEYLYFLADEHQDANNAQNSILERLASYFEEANLFIVGDEKQAIYRFQGASLENFLYFRNKFPNAKLIYLDENYRSHQSILDVSHALAEPLPGDKALRPRLLAKGASERGAIEVVSYQSEEDEALGVAECVKEELAKGVPAGEIAVLVRTNREITELGRTLAGSALPVALYQDEDVLSDPDIGKLMLLLRSVNDPENETLLAEAMFIDFLGLDPIAVTKALRKVRVEKGSLLDCLDNFPGFKESYVRWASLAKNRSALEVIEAILTESNLREALLKQPNAVEKLALLTALYQEVKSRQTHARDVTLAEFLGDLDTLAEHGARLRFPSRERKQNAVSVMTAHRAKGLEWRVVFIPHAVSGKWGQKRAHSTFRLPYPLGSAHQSGKEEDERRLFYVALTRAKERVVITYAAQAADGGELVPSQFIEELPADLVERKTGAEAGPAAGMLAALASRAAEERTLWDRDYLRGVFLEQGLNATALNNYIECPWKYFFKNLVRLPELMEKQQMYGTAVHAALAAMTNALRHGREFGYEDLYKAFRTCLDKEPLTKHDFEAADKKGKEILKALWDSEKELWHKNAIAELDVSGVAIDLPSGESLLLRGRLDKVDILSGDIRQGGSVCVVDFKTGRPKTRNEIEGKTKNATGNEKRQLDFYRLLLDLYDNGKYKMLKGTILFTEPDEKGRISKVEFEMSAEDAASARREAERVAGEILDFAFWDKDCGDKDCEYCNLRKVLVG